MASLLVAIGSFVAAAVVVPEVRTFLGLDKPVDQAPLVPPHTGDVQPAPGNRDISASEAAKCRDLDVCALIFELYRSDADFRAATIRLFQEGNRHRPYWVPRGVTTGVLPALVGAETFLLGQVCEPHECDVNWLYFAYDVNRKVMYGELTLGKEVTWLGRPNRRLQKLINDFGKGLDPFSIEHGDALKLPVIVD